MVNLLSANFLRLRKSKSFWISLAIMAAAGVFEPVLSYAAMVEFSSNGVIDASISLDSRYILFPFLSVILLSAFCTLFVGVEYSDGTIRRKLAVGHSRTAVYLSSLLLCVTAGSLLCLGYIAAVLAVGVPLLGPMRTPMPDVLGFTLCAFLMTAALCAVFVMLAMLYQNRAVSAVICIFLAYFLLFSGIFLQSRLSEPELSPERQYVENNQIVTIEARPNPSYVRGAKRAVYEFLYDLPGCQTVQLVTTMEQGVPRRLPLNSLTVLAASTGIGVALFRKKDLK